MSSIIVLVARDTGANAFRLNRQRKYLTPAFSHATIQELTPIYFDCAYKVSTNTLRPPICTRLNNTLDQSCLEAIIDASDGDDAVIEAQNWYASIFCIPNPIFSSSGAGFRELTSSTNSVSIASDWLASLTSSVLHRFRSPHVPRGNHKSSEQTSPPGSGNYAKW